jgi:hypothetical protein
VGLGDRLPQTRHGLTREGEHSTASHALPQQALPYDLALCTATRY